MYSFSCSTLNGVVNSTAAATRFRMLSSLESNDPSGSHLHVGSTIPCVRKVSFTTCVHALVSEFSSLLNLYSGVDFRVIFSQC